MFPSDEERIVPKKRIAVINILTQVFIALFLLTFFGLLFFEDFAPEITEFAFNYLIWIYIVGLVGIPLVFGLFSRWIQAGKWQTLAEELGLQTTQSNRWTLPTLQGTYRGHRVSISQTTQRRGRSRVYFTNYEVTLNTPIKATFLIEKRSLTHFNRNQIGDEAFDKKLSTQASSEELIRQLLRTRRLRLGIMQLGERARSRKLALNGKILTYVEGGQTTDIEYMRAVLNLLAELAHAIERMEQLDAFR